MSTISGNLALLQRTKAGQRALLEEMYPDMDFSTVPFREYGRLFTGRKYVPGFAGGWKAYGRSNSEDASTRDILPDYSGNGRDIKLYNFGFAGMSGWNGYGSTWNAYGDSAEQVNSNTVKIGFTRLEGVVLQSLRKGESLTVRYRITGLPSGSTLNLYTNTRNSESTVVFKSIREIEKDGTYTDTITWDSENAADDTTNSQVFLLGRDAAYPEDMAVLAEQLPLYPGALVSDGIDDYGQCIKGFALPDDYTVVAIRKQIDVKIGTLVSKGNVTKGAFGFEGDGPSAYSYGEFSSLSDAPALFSYQTKSSYNGLTINVGTETDTTEDKLRLFNDIPSSNYVRFALYDLRIYDHSLTAEELAAVKDEMMADYENATGGGINDITYVADWDGKGRSNDEEEPMRSQWVDKATGKVINLNNFGFAGMSGWNGYATDFIEKPWKVLNSSAYQPDLVTVEPLHLKFKGILTDGHTSCGISISNANIPEKAITYRLRVKGIKGNQIVRLRNESASPIAETLLREDGVIEMDISKGSVSGSLYLYMNSSGAATPDVDITIEQLPLYPGALVSDGVDDYIRAEEALGEVGTVLIHWKNIGLPVGHYLYNTGWEEDAGRLYCWNTQGNIACGFPHMQMDGHPIMIYHRSPLVSTMPLSSAGENNCPIFRLIFIKEQLDEYQQEFLKWKVEKEYRDWCKENGYEYAINQLTE